ncbi:acyl-CoA dehydrogenase family protein [Nakamurella sp. A5-74]|uniref:Acyl-CoA dehydrogenase family protein n=1 Tax=Nakamurella sp. A5-74 TaxID=3158264 RepID=A0AAU8DPZ3_9ACTN
MKSSFYTEDHEAYRESVRAFAEREVVPHYEKWEENHLIDRAVWEVAGAQQIIGLAAPESLGGGGEHDYRYRMIVAEELSTIAAPSMAAGFAVQDDLVLPYLLDLATPEQAQRLIPGLTAGTSIGAIAMTEPGAGSDLQGIATKAVRDGSDWILDGSKTFITNGIHADVVIVFARTDPSAGSKGYSLLLVERDFEGFTRGRKLDKVGMPGQDTAELNFAGVRVPAENLLGEEGAGLRYLMERLPRERISIAAAALTALEAAYRWTTDYVFDRKAFGQRIGDFQNTRFVLAEIETEIDITRAYVERCVLGLNEGELTTQEASKAKWWASELQVRNTSRLLQLYGGYGFMKEYPIGRAYADCRVQSIYGGTTEIMKEIIGRGIAGRYR